MMDALQEALIVAGYVIAVIKDCLAGKELVSLYDGVYEVVD